MSGPLGTSEEASDDVTATVAVSFLVLSLLPFLARDRISTPLSLRFLRPLSGRSVEYLSSALGNF